MNYITNCLLTAISDAWIPIPMPLWTTVAALLSGGLGLAAPASASWLALVGFAVARCHLRPITSLARKTQNCRSFDVKSPQRAAYCKPCRWSIRVDL